MYYVIYAMDNIMQCALRNVHFPKIHGTCQMLSFLKKVIDI